MVMVGGSIKCYILASVLTRVAASDVRRHDADFTSEGPETVVPGKLKLILFGPPASGKGTVAERLAEEFKLKHLSSGAVIRAYVNGPPNPVVDAAVKASLPLVPVVDGPPNPVVDAGVKTLIKNMMKTGMLLPYATLLAIVGPEITKAANGNGWILDGFPREAAQAEWLMENNYKPDLFVEIEVAHDEILVARITSRGDAAEAAGEERRADDTEETAKTRIATYKKQLAAVVKPFKDDNLYESVNGEQSPDDVYSDVIKSLYNRHLEHYNVKVMPEPIGPARGPAWQAKRLRDELVVEVNHAASKMEPVKRRHSA